MRLTRGRAADAARSELKADRSRASSRVKDYLSESWCCRASLARPRSCLPLKIRPSAPRSRVSPRIALAHKEAVYQRPLLDAVTHGRTWSRANRGEPLAPHAQPFISHFRRTGGFLVVLLAQTSLRRVFSRRDSPSSPRPTCVQRDLAGRREKAPMAATESARSLTALLFLYAHFIVGKCLGLEKKLRRETIQKYD